MTITADSIPGYRAGTWAIDGSHSEVSFSIRHLGLSKVKGKFQAVSGTITTGENPLDSKVDAAVEVSSVSTGQADRDGHLKSGDFFLAEEHPQITFVSTGVSENGGDLEVVGDFTMRGVTKQVAFDVEFGGFGEDNYGNYKLGLTATTSIKREDFGVSWNGPLDKGGMILGSDVKITIDVEAALQA